MIYLANELPKFCPSCGQEYTAEARRNYSADFFAGASSQCKCGAMYQYLDGSKLIEASKADNGDLHRYV